jgi:hypothetical protein
VGAEKGGDRGSAKHLASMNRLVMRRVGDSTMVLNREPTPEPRSGRTARYWSPSVWRTKSSLKFKPVDQEIRTMSMTAAIYARKSTEQSNIADDQRSIVRQVENARAYAAANGWTVQEAFIYQDDGMSGAEFVRRPGFLRLMNALKPRPRFQVLIMSEESRLGRESIETAYALKQLVTSADRGRDQQTRRHGQPVDGCRKRTRQPRGDGCAWRRCARRFRRLGTARRGAAPTR